MYSLFGNVIFHNKIVLRIQQQERIIHFVRLESKYQTSNLRIESINFFFLISSKVKIYNDNVHLLIKQMINFHCTTVFLPDVFYINKFTNIKSVAN